MSFFKRLFSRQTSQKRFARNDEFDVAREVERMLSAPKEQVGGGSTDADDACKSNLSNLQLLAAEQGQLFVEQINESLQLANNSINPETKVGRLEFAKSRLSELQALSATYPFIRITNLDAVQETVRQLAEEFSRAGLYANSDPSVWKIRSEIAEGVIDSWRFSATLHLRTPLRFLARHNQAHHAKDGPPPEVHMEHGCWMQQSQLFSEIGPDFHEFENSRSMASEIGPVPRDGGDFLDFLKVVREIVERDWRAEDRLAALRLALGDSRWQEFCVRLGGKEEIYDRFFPEFIECLPKLNAETLQIIWERGWVTPSALIAISDAELLGVKGIGPAKLKLLRQACINAKDKDSDRLDLVVR